MNVRVLFILFQVVLLQCLYADLVEEREYEYDNAREDEAVDDINDEQGEAVTESANIQDEISTELDEKIAESAENDDWQHQEQSVGGSILSDFIAKLSDDETAEREEREVNEEESSPNIVEYTLPQQAETEEPQKAAQNLHDLLETDVIQLSEVKVQILDKASSVCRDQILRTNEPYQLGDLTVTLKNAFMTAENVVPFSVIGFLDIKKGDTPVFQNWMSGTYKSAVTFDHAIYDIKLTNDRN